MKSQDIAVSGPQTEAILRTCNAKTHLRNTYKNVIPILITHTHYMTTHRGFGFGAIIGRVCAQWSAKWLQWLQGSNDPIMWTPWMPFGSYATLKVSSKACNWNWLKAYCLTVRSLQCQWLPVLTMPLIWSAVKQIYGFSSTLTCVWARHWLWLWLRFIFSIEAQPKPNSSRLSSGDQWFDRFGSSNTESEHWAHH